MKKRQRKKWLKQHGEYVNPRDTWALDYTIAEFALPRLKLYKEKLLHIQELVKQIHRKNGTRFWIKSCFHSNLF